MGELSAVDATALSGDELAERCMAVVKLLDVVNTHAAELTAEFEQRGDWAVDGATSAAAWLTARCRARKRDLAHLAKVGAALRDLPQVAEAVKTGEIGFDHVRRIRDCVQRHPAFDADDEAFLLDQARALDTETFRLVAREWRAAAEDTDDDDPPAPEPARREFVHLSETFEGWYRFDGELGPDNGAVVAAFFEEFVDKALRAQRDGDPSLDKLPPSGLRAEGLVDLVAQHQRREPSDKSVSDRYRVAVLVRPGEFPMEVCDSDLYRAVMTAEGEVLDIGRATREWTFGIRRAVTERDGGCVFPGCDRPPSWCDVHHCWEWEHGGPTSRDNGALLCRRHHTFVHAKKWRVVIPRPRGKPIVLRPDGTPFTITPHRLQLPAIG
jgi:hypothetical protein